MAYYPIPRHSTYLGHTYETNQEGTTRLVINPSIIPATQPMTTLGTTIPRTTTRGTTTHQDNYPTRIITPVDQLTPRAITPIARTTTSKDNYPIGELSLIPTKRFFSPTALTAPDGPRRPPTAPDIKIGVKNRLV